ncbi:hypothetical protein AVEN_219535-1 [Araneus ventricosus]|uniref:BTB domain-containing protein n=1 Tax=Araneus ventricosus TaxID=182803 RepID=A0A4Y2BPA3_ARAVE|nr:hypothetical protein AVEN_219535-1 [Araneus ventricosus]
MMKISILAIAVVVGICKFTSLPEKLYTAQIIRSNCDTRYIDIVTSMIELLESGTFSDFTIHVAGEKIRAHKAILAARSEFFNQRFQSGLAKKTNKIIVQELPSEAVKAMLRFMYAGEVDVNVLKYPAEVYTAACIFKLPLLQNILQRIFESNLNSDNAIKLLILANKHNDVILEEKALEFISKSGVYKRKPDDWVDFMENHPTLANKVVLFLNKKRQ